MSNKKVIPDYKFDHQFIIMNVPTEVFRYEYDENYIFIFTIYCFPNSYDVFVTLSDFAYQVFVTSFDRTFNCSTLSVEAFIDSNLDTIIHAFFDEFNIIDEKEES